jgi:hypothetical protein
MASTTTTPVAATAATATATMTPSEPSHTVPPSKQDEGVLMDVLQELDRERTKRAELEAKIRQLEQAAAAVTQKSRTLPPQATETDADPSRQALFLAMEAQLEGFRQLVDAMTVGKPAIAAAAAAAEQKSSALASASNNRRTTNNITNSRDTTTKTLALHVVRLLEVMPWDPRANAHIFAREQVYEWQIYDRREGVWRAKLQYFPAVFRSLPVTRPKPGSDNNNNGKTAVVQEEYANTKKERSLLLFLAGDKGTTAAPSKHGVLTNAAMTQVLNIEAGFPLPQDGGSWQWIGGWRVDKRVIVVTAATTLTTDDADAALRQKVDCDEHGWSYAREPQHFVVNPTKLVWDHDGKESTLNSHPQRRFRRRKWTRLRVLVDYPFASERTQNYLKLLAENTRLSVVSSKISDQLVETKMTLTETEQALMRFKEETTRQIGAIETDLQHKNELLKATGIPIENGSIPEIDGDNPLQDFLSKNEQVKEIGSKISQWVHATARKPGEDSGSNDSMEENPTQDMSANTRFAWKNFGRGKKMKQTQVASATSNGSSSLQKLPENMSLPESETVVEFTNNGSNDEDPEAEHE